MGDRCIDTRREGRDGCGRIAVFDLDGTVYVGPSFRRYLLYGSRVLAHRGMYGDALRIVWRFLLSKCGCMSHKDMKYRNCVLLEGRLSEDDNRRFARLLMSRVNDTVMGLKARFKSEGCLTVLSTASPESYCRALAEMLGFDLCHATPSAPETATDYIENRGGRKLDGIRRLEAETGMELAAVVTDHYDDIPLLRENREGSNFLVSPSEETVRRVVEASVAFKIL